ncbi:MAG: tRNA preQ1(34) S-adenosylmethionine ribosyltransferase-isomerase QueA [Candidatus Ancaeobacter aquaticus]|nr:tRNA preQ1(34) S-adenosylmethionine ribosyltransferase-isomerase QueA [Candidatus Ancaeobacter aquaticus]
MLHNVSNYDYELPQKLIAQAPVPERHMSRLMVLDRSQENITHKTFRDVVQYFNPGDCLVINNTKVIPARLYGKKSTGAQIEVLLLKKRDGNIWEVMMKPAKRIPVGGEIFFSDSRPQTPDYRLKATVREVLSDGKRIVEFDNNVLEHIHDIGIMPLPPYIKREVGDTHSEFDKERYQTVYAKTPGAVAAPTAGLHFSDELLEQLRVKGVNIVTVTLHVGYGTFKPVEVDDVRDHIMHHEYYEVTEDTAQIINETKKKSRRLIAVGTTSVRTLETVTDQDGIVRAGSGETNLFIYPPYTFKVVDAIITNFHLPRSTLLMMISAFAGKEFLFKAYNEAIENKYRFYSYGDAMYIV